MPVPIIPGITGYGTDTRAAYGAGTNPEIFRVTTLADSGVGSFRYAIEAPVPRVVLFETSGYCDALSQIALTSPYLTIAGQTAPSPGFTIRKHGINCTTHDVLLWHFAIRPGDWSQSDASQVCGFITYGSGADRVILVNMSVSWCLDENIAFSVYPPAASGNFTAYRCLSAEGLNNPASLPGNTGKGYLVQGGKGATRNRVSLVESIAATNTERNPYWQGNTGVAIINCLQYNALANWFNLGTNADLEGNNGGPWHVSIVNSVQIPGPETDSDVGSPQGWQFYYDDGFGTPGGNQIYRSGNLLTNPLAITMTTEGNELPYDPNVSSPPAQAPTTGVFSPMAAASVEAHVLANAGARPWDRDDVDTRIIADIVGRTSTAGYPAHQSDVGGYPALATNTRALTVPDNPHDYQASGYTILEEWLHGFESAGVPPTITVDSPVAVDASRVPAGSLVFTGFGDSGSMRYLSPTGTILARPANDPQPGSATSPMRTSLVTGALAALGGGPLAGLLFSSQLAQIAIFQAGAVTDDGWGLAVDEDDHFYTIKQTTSATATTFHQWSAAGVLLHSWTITNPTFSQTRSKFGVNADGTLAFVFKTTGPGDGNKWRVHVFDLTGAGAYVGQLHATDYSALADGDIIGVQDGSGDVLVAYRRYNTTSGTFNGAVVRYQDDGTIVRTYQTGTEPIFLAEGLTSASFWVNALDSAVATASGARATEFALATGAILHTFTPEDGAFEFDSALAVLRVDVDAYTVVLPPATPTPAAPHTPCTPQAQVSGGGVDNTGCNVGGVGRTEIPFDAYGSALEHPDPDPAEDLSGKAAVDLWVTWHHVDYPSGITTPYHFSLAELADDPSYYGGRKPAGLLSVGTISYGCGTETNGFAASSADIRVSDALLRRVRTILGDQTLDGDRIEVYLASRAARDAGDRPRTLFRGVIQGPETESSLVAILNAVDSLFALYGPLGAFPQFPFWSIGQVFADAPEDVKALPLPFLYGPLHDDGAVDPITNVPREKGLAPWHWVGRIPIPRSTSSAAQLPSTIDAGIGEAPSHGILGMGEGDLVSDGTVTHDPYHAFVRVKGGVMGTWNAGRASTPAPTGSVYGFRDVIDDPDWETAADYYLSFEIPAAVQALGWNASQAVPAGYEVRYQVIAKTPTDPYDDWSHIAYWPTRETGLVWGAVAQTVFDWDAFVVLHGATYQGGGVFGSDLGHGDPNATPDRTALEDSRNGTDYLWPWNSDGTRAGVWTAIFGDRTFVDVVGSDGYTYRLTMGFARGAVADDHKNERVNLASQIFAGTEDVGDGTGLPIVAFHHAQQHWLENRVLLQYRGGNWATLDTAPKFPAPDALSIVRSQRFHDRQDFTEQALGGIGLEIRWYCYEFASLSSIFEEFNINSETQLGTNDDGRVSLWYIDETVPASTWPRVVHQHHLFGRIRTRYHVGRETSVTAACDWDPGAKKARIGPIAFRNDTAIAQNKGVDKPGQPLVLKMLGKEAHMRWVVQRRLARLGPGMTLMDVPLTLGALDVNVDAPGIRLTTIEGPGEEGYVDRPMQIRWRQASLGPGRSVADTLLDVHDLLLFPPGSTQVLMVATDDTGLDVVATDNEDIAPIAML